MITAEDDFVIRIQKYMEDFCQWIEHAINLCGTLTEQFDNFVEFPGVSNDAIIKCNLKKREIPAIVAELKELKEKINIENAQFAAGGPALKQMNQIYGKVEKLREFSDCMADELVESA